MVAPEIVTHEDIISIDAPQAAIHSRVPQPSKPGTAVTRDERPETRVTHLSSWAPVLEEGKVKFEDITQIYLKKSLNIYVHEGL